jgi:hypothetical protein
VSTRDHRISPLLRSCPLRRPESHPGSQARPYR